MEDNSLLCKGSCTDMVFYCYHDWELTCLIDCAAVYVGNNMCSTFVHPLLLDNSVCPATPFTLTWKCAYFRREEKG